MMARRMGRPPKGEKYVELKRVTYRLPDELVKALKKAARRAKLNLSEYVEQAITERIKRDNIQ